MRMTRPALLIGLLLAGCVPIAAPPALSETPPLVGQVEGAPARGTQATTAEVANGATISLIEPSTGTTLATTLTAADGRFSLTFKGGFKPGGAPYFLEAMKGLSNNGAGVALIRLRTLVAHANGAWITLSGSATFLNRSTTALSALSNLKDFSDSQNMALMGSLSMSTPETLEGITTPDTYTPPDSLTAVLTASEFHRAWSLVDQAVTRDVDPIAGLFSRPATGSAAGSNVASESFGIWDGFGWQSDGFVFSSLSAVTVARGGTVTLYGHGLATTTAGARVTLGPGGTACPVTAASANGTSLTISIPAGATPGSYSLQLIIGPWTATRTLTVT